LPATFDFDGRHHFLDLFLKSSGARSMPDTSAPLTVRELRRRWKPHKESLKAVQEHHLTAVRLHRPLAGWFAGMIRARNEQANSRKSQETAPIARLSAQDLL
jgi:hypothetical protein